MKIYLLLREIVYLSAYVQKAFPLFKIFGVVRVVGITKLADKLLVGWWADVDGYTHGVHYTSMSTGTTH